VPCSRTASCGCRTGGEVVENLHLRPHRRLRRRRGRPSPTEKEYRSRVFAQAQIASEGKRGYEGVTHKARMGHVDDAARGRAANLKGRIISATASSASQLTSRSTIAPRINFSFMAISRKSNPSSGPRFHVYLPIDVGCASHASPQAEKLKASTECRGPLS